MQAWRTAQIALGILGLRELLLLLHEAHVPAWHAINRILELRLL